MANTKSITWSCECVGPQEGQDRCPCALNLMEEEEIKYCECPGSVNKICECEEKK